MKKRFATVFDELAKQQETIVVSGGKIGLQIEAGPTTSAQSKRRHLRCRLWRNDDAFDRTKEKGDENDAAAEIGN